MSARTLVLGALALLLTGPLVAGVSVDYDTETDFGAYSTYAWDEGTHADNDLSHSRIVEAIESRLEEAGLQQVDGDADLRVVYHVALREGKRIDVDDFGYWRGWRGVGASSVNVYDVTVGTLIVDMLDGGSGALVWRAMAQQEITGNPSPEKTKKKLKKITGKMFRKFPPE